MDPPFAAHSPIIDAERPQSRPGRIAHVAVAVGVFLALSLFLTWPFITSENFGKTQGKDIPVALPDEANRVRCDARFAIVMPEHWEVRSIRFEPEGGRINAFPRSVIPRRFSATMSARSLAANPPKDLAGYRRTQFQGRPAYEAVMLRPYADYETPAWFYYTLCFERNGRWYELSYGLAEERKTLPSEVWPYFNTFRETNEGPASEP